MVDRWSGSIEAGERGRDWGGRGRGGLRLLVLLASFSPGVTAIRPEDLEFPNTMTDIDYDTWMLRWIQAGGQRMRANLSRVEAGRIGPSWKAPLQNVGRTGGEAKRASWGGSRRWPLGPRGGSHGVSWVGRTAVSSRPAPSPASQGRWLSISAAEEPEAWSPPVLPGHWGN